MLGDLLRGILGKNVNSHQAYALGLIHAISSLVCFNSCYVLCVPAVDPVCLIAAYAGLRTRDTRPAILCRLKNAIGRTLMTPLRLQYSLHAQEDCPLYSEGEERHSVLQAAAMAAKWWEPPRDALDSMVLKAAALHELDGYTHLDFTPFDPALKVGPRVGTVKCST
jgi:hypothetical protein